MFNNFAAAVMLPDDFRSAALIYSDSNISTCFSKSKFSGISNNVEFSLFSCALDKSSLFEVSNLIIEESVSSCTGMI